MQLHCHCSICMSIVFTASAARPCKELRGAPIQWHTKPYHTMPHPAYDTWPQRTAPHRSRPDHTIPYPSSVVSRNLAVLLSGSSGWHTLIVTQTRSGPKLTDAETSYLVCYFFRLFSTLLALLFNHRPHNGKLLKQGMGNGKIKKWERYRAYEIKLLIGLEFELAFVPICHFPVPLPLCWLAIQMPCKNFSYLT